MDVLERFRVGMDGQSWFGHVLTPNFWMVPEMDVDFWRKLTQSAAKTM